MAGLAIMTLGQFMERHDKKAAVVISSYKNRKEMSEQLQGAGFSSERIIDGGGTIYQLTERRLKGFYNGAKGTAMLIVLRRTWET